VLHFKRKSLESMLHKAVAPKIIAVAYSTYGKMISNITEVLEVLNGSRTAGGLDAVVVDAVGYDVDIPPRYVGRHGCFPLPVFGAGSI
jgi:hypothetical protein